MARPPAIEPAKLHTHETVMVAALQPIKKDRATDIVEVDEGQAAIIKGMLARGDKQSDIAAFFGLNGGRIAEINRHQRFRFVHAAKAEDLPPRGPYLSPVAIWQLRHSLKELRDTVDKALASIGGAP